MFVPNDSFEEGDGVELDQYFDDCGDEIVRTYDDDEASVLREMGTEFDKTNDDREAFLLESNPHIDEEKSHDDGYDEEEEDEDDYEDATISSE
mmetsp:Transcript_27496/g.24229  ORF Transcript_27496/g.24229 Transcript_27496/m.24229 type:complete len:93 (+) Transcript_27496:1789-2067(+)